jgi:regulation of enolase protein 1 (concanavalin A-like superfamily)
MGWFNEPPDWRQTGDRIIVTTGPQTDFWCRTHYGFVRDSGHFFHQRVVGNFVAEVRFSGDYVDTYDQAGLMVRRNQDIWVKCGVEYFDDQQHLSTVVTHHQSDWSVIPLADYPAAVWLRLIRRGDALQVLYALEGRTYHLMRLAYFPPNVPVDVGPMACSPVGEGFTATFDGFTVRAPRPGEGEPE